MTMTSIAATPLAPTPSRWVMATTEQLNLTLNCTPLLNAAANETIQSATTTLTNVSVGRGTPVSGLATPQVSNPYIGQFVVGTLLVAGDLFELEFDFLTTQGNRWTQILTIAVPR